MGSVDLNLSGLFYAGGTEMGEPQNRHGHRSKALEQAGDDDAGHHSDQPQQHAPQYIRQGLQVEVLLEQRNILEAECREGRVCPKKSDGEKEPRSTRSIALTL